MIDIFVYIIHLFFCDTFIHTDVTKYCRTHEIFAHTLTSLHVPEEEKKRRGGSQPSLSQAEQPSHCSVFGCSCMVFLPDGPSMSARENNI